VKAADAAYLVPELLLKKYLEILHSLPAMDKQARAKANFWRFCIVIIPSTYDTLHFPSF
jgi:hypothetical protein